MIQWTPILTDAAKDKACGKIHEIAETVAAKDLRRNTYGLMAGNVGIALFFYYYWQWSGKEEYYDKASELILDSMDRMTIPLHSSTTPLTIESSFYNGVGGVGWGINHLFTHEFIEGEIGDSMGTVDPWLYRRMIYDLRQSEPGLLRGAAGIGLYAAGRDDRLSKEYLRRFVTELSGILSDRPFDAVTDYSVAHGIGGLILLLVKIGAKHADIKEIPVLLDYFREGLASHIRNVLLPKIFPERIEPGWKDEMLSVLWVSLCSRLVDRKLCDILMARSVDIYRERISVSESFDAGLSGGLVSAAHIMNRIYRFTGNEEYRELARTLYEKEIDAAVFDDPISGHKMWLTDADGLYGLHMGLFEGLSGIGLAFIAAVSDREPAWDECLMMS